MGTKWAKGIFYHKVNSNYNDVTGVRYHFPKSYLSRVRQTIGDWIIYYGPLPQMRSRYYSGIASVKVIEPDHEKADHFYAYFDSYLDFDDPVDYLYGGGFETKLVGPGMVINPGRSVQAVRIIEEKEFVAIVSAGLGKPDEWPDRLENQSLLHVEEAPQSPYDAESFERPIILQTISRPLQGCEISAAHPQSI